MSEQWQALNGRCLERSRLTRRAMLTWSARMGVGAAGIALVGCGGDDDDDDAPAAAATEEAEQAEQAEEQAQAEAEPEEQAVEEEEEDEPAEEDEPEPEPAGPEPPVLIEVVALGGDAGAVVLRNVTDAPVDLSGWFLCQFPNYWGLPPLVLPSGETVTAHVGAGEGTDTDLFSNGTFGTLGASGEMALYSSGAFDDAEAMVSYVGWGGGGMRKGVAQAAGVWGNPNLDAAQGDALVRTGEGHNADAFSVEAGGAAAFSLASFEPEGVAIVEVGLGGPESTVVLRNFSDETVSLDGWFLCNVPNYWPLPTDLELAAGETVLIDFNAGGNAPINAGGTLGQLDGGPNGEIGLYSRGTFGDSDAIVSYVAWNGGRGRKDVAQGAGIWGDDDVTASDGDIIVFNGRGEGAAGYEVR